MWRFFASFSNDLVSFMPRIEDAFSIYMRMLLGMAAVFQMPALVFFLARMGVVTARWMIRQFKYAVLVIVIVAAIITPSSDVASQMIVAVPMVVLYVLSIAIAWVFGKKKTADDWKIRRLDIQARLNLTICDLSHAYDCASRRPQASPSPLPSSGDRAAPRPRPSILSRRRSGAAACRADRRP